jgi:hypothetical protein
MKLEYEVVPRRRAVGHEAWRERMRASEDGLTVPDLEPNLTSSTLIIDDETREPVLAYLPLPDGVNDLRRAVRNIRYGETLRQSSGLRNKSRTFGMAPRKMYQKRESCRPTALSTDQPDEHAVIVGLGDLCADVLREIAPEVMARDEVTMRVVESEWRLADRSTWTSGVVNNTTVLPYHVDGANFPTWSAMPVLRRGVRGGRLHVPEYDLVVGCRDGWMVAFNGYELWHGVTPLRVAEADGYRISVVYYSLRGMKDCFTYAVEAAEGAIRRTAREDGIAAALKGERPFDFQPQ